MFSSFTFGHVLGLEILHVPIVFILGNVLGLNEWQARSSLYANTQLRAHRRAENKNKEQKKK